MESNAAMMASVRPAERNAIRSETSKVPLRFAEVTEVLSMQTPPGGFG